jgi:hypothetical protein
MNLSPDRAASWDIGLATLLLRSLPFFGRLIARRSQPQARRIVTVLFPIGIQKRCRKNLLESASPGSHFIAAQPVGRESAGAIGWLPVQACLRDTIQSFLVAFSEPRSHSVRLEKCSMSGEGFQNDR